MGAEGGGDDEDAVAMKQLRRHLSAAEYEIAHRRGLHRLKPLAIGPVWLSHPAALTELAPQALPATLSENKENVESVGFSSPSPNGSVEEVVAKGVLDNLCVYRVGFSVFLNGLVSPTNLCTCRFGGAVASILLFGSFGYLYCWLLCVVRCFSGSSLG